MAGCECVLGSIMLGCYRKKLDNFFFTESVLSKVKMRVPTQICVMGSNCLECSNMPTPNSSYKKSYRLHPTWFAFTGLSNIIWEKNKDFSTYIFTLFTLATCRGEDHLKFFLVDSYKKY